jgi:hypothetical protein
MRIKVMEIMTNNKKNKKKKKAGEAVGGKLFKNVLCESELFKFHIVFDMPNLRYPLLSAVSGEVVHSLNFSSEFQIIYRSYIRRIKIVS